MEVRVLPMENTLHGPVAETVWKFRQKLRRPASVVQCSIDRGLINESNNKSFSSFIVTFLSRFDSRKPYNDALPSTLHCSGQFLTSIFFLIQTIPHQVQAHSQSVCVCLNCRSIWEQNTILCYSMIFIQITDIFHYLVVRVRTFASFKKFTPYFACADLQGVGQNPSLKKSTFIKFKEWKKHRVPLPRPNTIIPEIKIWIRACVLHNRV